MSLLKRIDKKLTAIITFIQEEECSCKGDGGKAGCRFHKHFKEVLDEDEDLEA